MQVGDLIRWVGLPSPCDGTAGWHNLLGIIIDIDDEWGNEESIIYHIRWCDGEEGIAFANSIKKWTKNDLPR
jgi:hypothetical protein